MNVGQRMEINPYLQNSIVHLQVLIWDLFENSVEIVFLLIFFLEQVELHSSLLERASRQEPLPHTIWNIFKW